ncbi:hypothetical protein ACWD3Z_34835 [Streptomyces sp. NPDC002740]
MSERVGCAGSGPDEQDLAAQREILLGPGVPEDRIRLRVLERHENATAPSTSGGR